MPVLFESRGLFDPDPENKRDMFLNKHFLRFSDTEDKGNKLVQSAGNYLPT